MSYKVFTNFWYRARLSLTLERTWASNWLLSGTESLNWLLAWPKTAYWVLILEQCSLPTFVLGQMFYQLLWVAINGWTDFYLLRKTFTDFDGRNLLASCSNVVDVYRLLTIGQTVHTNFCCGRQDLLTIITRLRSYWLPSGENKLLLLSYQEYWLLS